ncbi:auxin-induced protein 22D-like [Dioscorea cayenensis subsp. rotundata]|uniref:Auxin-responsive protein n=1 Tax=Dioscorea cayennensis subsp. rotundata TaxID=55577 RepID=A0AB40BY78_DIOCR|nr:auxin-induced protein 22D-like [Dioscorea cayenensis subsp. rotundata]
MEVRTRYGDDIDIDNLKATELRLGPPGTGEEVIPTQVVSRGNKRALPEDSTEYECEYKRSSSETASVESCLDTSPAAKAQVVGWPPIRSYRKKSFEAIKEVDQKGGLYVKVSMDGAPYLRKIDLNVYQGYEELRLALEDMFKCFSIGELYAIAYEDKDGDLMLVGDVPWRMFISSCKRMRIMKGCEARGLSSNS